MSVVSSALQLLHWERPITGGDIKAYLWPLLHLGDRVSVAVLKIYNADELTRPENAHAYLTVARNAFSDRSSVLEKSDTDPKVTLFLLGYLKDKELSSPEIEKRIAYLQRCVTDFACSSQGEYDFCLEFKNTGMGEITDDDGVHLGFANLKGSDGSTSTVLYENFGSTAAAQAYLEKRIAKAAKLIERGGKRGTTGEIVGVRAEIVLRLDAGKTAPAVLWTDGVKFHLIYSSSRESMLALEKVYKY